MAPLNEVSGTGSPGSVLVEFITSATSEPFSTPSGVRWLVYMPSGFTGPTLTVKPTPDTSSNAAAKTAAVDVGDGESAGETDLVFTPAAGAAFCATVSSKALRLAAISNAVLVSDASEDLQESNSAAADKAVRIEFRE